MKTLWLLSALNSSTLAGPLRSSAETGEKTAVDKIEQDQYSAATVISFNKPAEDCGDRPELINASYLTVAKSGPYEDKEEEDIQCNNSSSTATMRCRCRDEVFPGFSLFIGCRWEVINGDSCPSADFITTTLAPETTNPATTVATTTTAAPTQKPGVVTGVGVLESLDDSFKVHIEGLQLQVDQIRVKMEDQDELIQQYEDENQELKTKLKEMEGLLAGEDMRDVVEGHFMLTSYIIELLTSTDIAHSKLNILRQIPIVEPLLKLDITSIESRFSQSLTGDNFQPEYAVYFEASLTGLITNVEVDNALQNIFAQIDGFHDESIIITSHERKSREDKQVEELHQQLTAMSNQMESNFTKINDDLNNIYYETNDIKHINHNLIILQEEMAQFHAEELPTLQKTLEDANEQVNRNELNIEALADQVYGLDILTSTTGQLSAASSELSSVASSKQLENFENFNNMMMFAMQNELQQMKQQMARPVVPDRQQLMAELREELKFEKALMMAEVEKTMRKKEDELLERVAARINIQGQAANPPDFMKTENIAATEDIVSGLSDNAVRAELDRMFIMHKLGIEQPK